MQVRADTKRAEADAAYSIQQESQRKTIEITRADADIARREKEAELAEKEIAIQERKLDAEVRKAADAKKYQAEREAEAELARRQREADAQKYEAEQQAQARRAEAEAQRYAMEQEAEGIRARGLAEAEAIERKAEAPRKMGEASILDRYLAALPEVVKNAALPLALDGNLVKNFWMEFKGGKIVDVHAEEGEEILRNSIAMDEGSAYLGEVALVPFDSPINNTGILFFETLFDENASCHLAFGAAYPTCVRGGERLSQEEQKAAGLNQSHNHVDFMVGTRDLSIVGTTHDGREIPVFVNGNFAF